MRCHNNAEPSICGYNTIVVRMFFFMSLLKNEFCAVFWMSEHCFFIISDHFCCQKVLGSVDDNWMTTEASMRLYDRAKGYREKLFVDEKPAYVSEESIMHAMPVGEQFHWVKHLAADFIAERLTDKESSK